MEHSPEDPRWPRWPGPPLFSELARYVVAPDTMRRILGESYSDGEDERAAASVEERLTRVRALVEDFARKRYPYRLEPWDPSGQWIRDPRWFERQSGTCLDFALVFAARCLDQRVAPVIAITLDHADQTSAHALLLLDLERDLDVRGAPSRLTRLLADVGDDSASAEITDPEPLRSLIQDGAVAAVDMTAAARGPGGAATFEDVRDAGAIALLDARWRRCALVDVAGAWNQELSPFEPLPDTDWPAITRRVPPLPAQEIYVERSEVEAALESAGSRIVLGGARGFGKSLLAQRIAMGFAGGAGWFLTGSDRATLLRSMGLAELAELSLPEVDAPALDDLSGYAVLARERLRHPTPWIVVVDNCDGPAEAIADLLPSPGSNQKLVITTANTEWRRWIGDRADHEEWSWVSVGPLSQSEVGSVGCPIELVDVVDGRPLFAQAFARLARHVAPTSLSKVFDEKPADVDAAAWLLWRESQKVLTGREAAVAQAAAWLQPDGIPPTAAVGAAGFELSDSAEIVVRLESVGLVSRVGDALRMHRLIGAAIRAATSDGVALGVLGSEAYLADGIRRADSDVLDLSDERLRTIATPSLELARALRTLMELLEPRNQVKRAAKVAERLKEVMTELGLAGIADEEADSMLADADHAVARWCNQDPDASLSDVERGIALADASRARRDRRGDRIGVAKSDALKALLLPKTIDHEELGPGAVRVLREALTALEESLAIRLAELGEFHPDTARAEFNLGGRRVVLAQAEPERAAEHLNAAEEAYKNALRVRRSHYRTDLHPHIPASWNGLALVEYYRAVLVASSATERSASLRAAYDDAVTAVRLRQALDAEVDGSDTAKSTLLLAKIADARSTLPRSPAKASEVLEKDWRIRSREYRIGGLVSDD